MKRKTIVPVSIAAIAVILIAVFHGQLWSWFFGGGSPSGRSAGVQTAAAGLSVEAAIEPDPPRQGKNALIISLERNGAPVAGAEVGVQVWMPAMGSMPEMRTTADVTESEPGVYRAAFDLSMGGSWTATIKARAGDTAVSADYGLTVGTSGLRAMGTTADDGAARGGPAAHTFSDEGRSAVLAALDAYEVIRAALASDSPAPLAEASKLIGAALRKAETVEAEAPEPIREHLARGAKAADALGDSVDVQQARERFSALSQHLVALAAADPAVAEGRHVFECPMWDGFSRWIQPSDKLENPYMGQKMLTCGSEQPWKAAAAPAEPEQVHDPGEISHYTCAMHPWVKKDNPDEVCPVCSMDLTPVTKQEVTEGIIRIDRERRQAFGVTTAPVARRRLIVPVKAVGKVVYDERRLADVTLKYKGWIERLHVEETGERVRKGQVLFEVYSPELFAAQHELILAASEAESATTETQKARAAALLSGARKRMKLWDLTEGQINAIIASGEPRRQVAVRSPASGYVIEKNVVEGAAVEPGTQLYRIADLDRVWVEAEVYEEQIPLIKKGQGVEVKLTHVDAEPIVGVVSFIYPFLEGKTRTARVRIELDNKSQKLLPDMFAEVHLKVDRGEALAVPEAAIIYSGPRRIVFVDVGQDRLRPTVIETGIKSDGWVEVKKGLEAGDVVVVSGNFLVAAESRLKSATGIW